MVLMLKVVYVMSVVEEIDRIELKIGIVVVMMKIIIQKIVVQIIYEFQDLIVFEVVL